MGKSKCDKVSILPGLAACRQMDPGCSRYYMYIQLERIITGGVSIVGLILKLLLLFITEELS